MNYFEGFWNAVKIVQECEQASNVTKTQTKSKIDRDHNTLEVEIEDYPYLEEELVAEFEIETEEHCDSDRIAEQKLYYAQINIKNKYIELSQKLGFKIKYKFEKIVISGLDKEMLEHSLKIIKDNNYNVPEGIEKLSSSGENFITIKVKGIEEIRKSHIVAGAILQEYAKLYQQTG